MTPAQRSLYGRIGAAVARSRHTPAELTRAARVTFLLRFERQIREEFPDISEAEVQRRAGELRRAHMLALSARSAKKRAATRDKVTAQEERDATARPPTAA
jgi:hypothetical protein